MDTVNRFTLSAQTKVLALQHLLILHAVNFYGRRTFFLTPQLMSLWSLVLEP